MKHYTQCRHNHQDTTAPVANKWQRDAFERQETNHSPDINNCLGTQPYQNA